MRFVRALFIVLCVGVVAPAGAGPHATTEIRARAGGGQAVYVDGTLLWPAAGAARAPKVTGPMRWSRRGDAVAWIAKDGASTLLVVGLVGKGSERQALEWALPEAALPAKAIMWLGPSKVAVGPREMEPRLVASWKTTSEAPR
jgi:hypothetical protein